MVAFRSDCVDRGLKERGVVANVIEQMEQAHKPRSCFRAKGGANVLRLSGGGSNEPLLAGLVADSAASELEEVASAGDS
ncbi:hypothetical protein HBI42_218500 [Parastagonospora nodorum]|nr:hypothetical protein HBI43_216050 [Parastagonospora nodorum]KAH6243429.1 hypothetical protein HBI42_218500 [Parastagonospora nodorum]